MIRIKNNIRRASKGFTLVEILIVLALIGIVAGLAMSNLGEIFGGGQGESCKNMGEQHWRGLCYELFCHGGRVS